MQLISERDVLKIGVAKGTRSVDKLDYEPHLYSIIQLFKMSLMSNLEQKSKEKNTNTSMTFLIHRR